MNYYPASINYISLRRILKLGKINKGPRVIKEFHCDCEKHHGKNRTILVTQNTNAMIINHCEWHSDETGTLAIDSAGALTFQAYRFYSTHPDWKVRVAVAIGLAKLDTKESRTLLLSFVKDKHYGVSLAALQALENSGSSKTEKLLNKIRSGPHKKRVQKVITRIIQRIKFGINFNRLVKQLLMKLISKGLVKKISDQKNKTTHIFIPKKIITGLLSKRSVEKYLASKDFTSHTMKLSNTLLIRNKKVFLIQNERASAKQTKRRKLAYMMNLIYKNSISRYRAPKDLHPTCGEVYWAETSHSDPKQTRPVLILKPIHINSEFFLVAPLTSDISNARNHFLVTVEDQVSKVQLSRQKVIHQSLLRKKYTDLLPNEFQKILANKQIGILRVDKKNVFRKKLFTHKPQNFQYYHVGNDEIINNESNHNKLIMVKNKQSKPTSYHSDNVATDDTDPKGKKKKKKKSSSNSTMTETGAAMAAVAPTVAPVRLAKNAAFFPLAETTTQGSVPGKKPAASSMVVTTEETGKRKKNQRRT